MGTRPSAALEATQPLRDVDEGERGRVRDNLRQKVRARRREGGGFRLNRAGRVYCEKNKQFQWRAQKTRQAMEVKCGDTKLNKSLPPRDWKE